MQELKVNGYDLLNPINGKEQQVIDCFVQFFGEGYRELITERFNSTKSLFLPKTANGYELLINVLQANQKKEYNKLVEKFYGEIGYNHQHITNRVFSPDIAFVLKSKILTNKVSGNDYKMIYEVLLCKFNIPFSKNAKEIVDSYLASPKDKKQLIAVLDEIQDKWKKSSQNQQVLQNNEEINAIIEKIQEINNFTNKQGRLADEEMKKHIVARFATIKNVSEEEILKEQNINNYVEQMKKIALNSTVDFLSDRWIDQEEYNDIKLYNFLGFKHGRDYGDYLDDEALISAILNNKFIDEIKSVWAKHIEQIIKNDIFMNYAHNIAIGTKLYCSKGYIIKEMFEASTKELDGIASTLTVFDENGKLVNFCIFDSPYLCGDDTLIHEHCHAISSFGEINEELQVKINCGISKIGFTDYDSNEFKFEDLLKSFEQDNAKTQAVMLNEVITDYFAYKILNIFKQNNIQICKGKNETSCYAIMFGMMQELIEENIETFKKAYITGDITTLYEVMNKEDVKELKDIIDEVYKCYDNVDFREFEREIKEKTGIKENILYGVKPYINKDMGWSSEIKKLFACYNKIDKIAENIKNNQEKLKNIDKNK